MSASFYRRLLLLSALTGIGLFLAWLALPLLGDAVPEFARWGVGGTPLAIAPDSLGIAGSNAIFVGLMLLAQWAFLRPLRRAATGATNGRPRWHAILAVAFAAMLLCVGTLATLLEMPDAWKHVAEAAGGWIWTSMALIWAGWCAVFFVYFRQGDFLGRAEVVVRALIRGSALELLVAIPTHALVYRRSTENCYCERGSYTGMVFGFAVLLWAFGPGLLLLYLREHDRRTPILQRLCPRCGANFEWTSKPLAVCPRCGHALPTAGAEPSPRATTR